MHRIVRFSLNYPTTILMMVLAIFLLGSISFRKLGIELFPELRTPRIFVELKAGERPPEEMEKQFVEAIESLAIRQKKVIQVHSICRVGSAQITAEYAWNADMDEAFLDLQKALNTFAQNSELDEINITQHDPNAAPVLLLALSHPQIFDMDALRQVAESYLRSELIRLEGVAEVEILGEEIKEVTVETDPYLLEAYQLSADVIASRLRNFNRNITGGSIVELGRKYVIKGVGELQTLEDIGDVILGYNQSTASSGNDLATSRVPIYLKNVATISFLNKEPENIVRVDGQRCVALAIYKETKFNSIQVVQDVMTSLQGYRKALPGFNLMMVQNQGDFIKTSIDEVKQSALIGIFLAIIVIYVFLRRIGVTFIVGLAIPISIIATFNLMYFQGLTLNIMTLGGLALGAGMLVDNAIVVTESIFRNLESGTYLDEAIINGTSQVAGAITGSTLTTIVVFLPIVYLHGTAGELFKDQAWTVAFSLLASLVVAILVLPMLAKFVIKPGHKPQTKALQFLGYRSILSLIIERPWRYIIFAAALLAVCAMLIPFVGSEFMPRPKSKEYVLKIQLPEGTELKRTAETVINIEDLIGSVFGANLKMTFSTIGPTSAMSNEQSAVFENENTAVTKIFLKNLHSNTQEQLAQIRQLLSEIPDIEFQLAEELNALEATLGVEEAPIIVEISGRDLRELQNLVDQVKNQLLGMKELQNITTSFDVGRPEVEIVIDRIRAGLLSVNLDHITSALQDHLAGRLLGQWEHGGDLQDITLKLPKLSIAELSDLNIQTGAQKVRLDDVADIRVIQAPEEISRRNQVRIGKVMASIQSNKPYDHIIHQIEKRLENVLLPIDYKWELAGEEQKRRESFHNLGFALILSLILVYMVMASQFESLLHPFTILLTIPMAFSGSVLIFFLFGKSFNIMGYIGLIMLGGIAVNDSIILVDAINQFKAKGFELKDAILQAGQQRIRPIIITSLTTILALLPLTLGFGEGAELRAPMALAVIGGLISSTVLTLVIIPCVYLKMDQLAVSIKYKLFGRLDTFKNLSNESSL